MRVSAPARPPGRSVRTTRSATPSEVGSDRSEITPPPPSRRRPRPAHRDGAAGGRRRSRSSARTRPASPARRPRGRRGRRSRQASATSLISATTSSNGAPSRSRAAIRASPGGTAGGRRWRRAPSRRRELGPPARARRRPPAPPLPRVADEQVTRRGGEPEQPGGRAGSGAAQELARSGVVAHPGEGDARARDPAPRESAEDLGREHLGIVVVRLRPSDLSPRLRSRRCSTSWNRFHYLGEVRSGVPPHRRTVQPSSITASTSISTRQRGSMKPVTTIIELADARPEHLAVRPPHLPPILGIDQITAGPHDFRRRGARLLQRRDDDLEASLRLFHRRRLRAVGHDGAVAATETWFPATIAREIRSPARGSRRHPSRSTRSS